MGNSCGSREWPCLRQVEGPRTSRLGWLSCLEVIMNDLGWSASALAAYSDSELVALVRRVFACLACLAVTGEGHKTRSAFKRRLSRVESSRTRSSRDVWKLRIVLS